MHVIWGIAVFKIFIWGGISSDIGVRNLVLLRQASEDVKRDFLMYIRRYTSPNENFEYGYPHSNALLQFCVKFERCKPHKATYHPMKCDVINLKIYCLKYLMLSNRVVKESTLEYVFCNHFKPC